MLPPPIRRDIGSKDRSEPPCSEMAMVDMSIFRTPERGMTGSLPLPARARLPAQPTNMKNPRKLMIIRPQITAQTILANSFI